MSGKEEEEEEEEGVTDHHLTSETKDTECEKRARRRAKQTNYSCNVTLRQCRQTDSLARAVGISINRYLHINAESVDNRTRFWYQNCSGFHLRWFEVRRVLTYHV